MLRRIQARVSHQFNISVTECGAQDLWQSAVLGFGVVGSSRHIVESTLHQAADFIDRLNLAQLAEAEIEFFDC